MRVLLLEDASDVSEAVIACLLREGGVTDRADSVVVAQNISCDQTYDIALIDTMPSDGERTEIRSGFWAAKLETRSVAGRSQRRRRSLRSMAARFTDGQTLPSARAGRGCTRTTGVGASCARIPGSTTLCIATHRGKDGMRVSRRGCIRWRVVRNHGQSNGRVMLDGLDRSPVRWSLR